MARTEERGDDGAGATADPLADRLARWVRMELITDEQARRILEAEEGGGPAQAPARAVSPVAEALGYVGGVLVLVAAVTLTGRYWTELPVGGRIAIALVAAALLLGIGAAVPQAHDAGRRLRAVTWTLSVVALGFGVGVLTDEAMQLRSEVHVMLTGAACAAYAGVLWWRLRVALLHLVLAAAVFVTVGAATALLPGDDGEVAGLAVWGAGVAWLLLGWGDLLPPWQAADVAGAAAVIVGAAVTLDEYWGPAPALLTMVGLVAAGVAVRDLWLTGAGTVATLTLVPALSQKWFPDTLAAPITLLVAGALLVTLAVRGIGRARRGGRRAFGERRPGPPRTAVAGAAVVGVATAAVVVALGLS
ncbi:DUF2157 domain-containing protein [Pseudonocardia sp.]|uniref:DUF2157 domain-containing protein n=1 Tax=Pseudonocardia sp. TaxID=60912 RepID=UPI003D09EBC0